MRSSLAMSSLFSSLFVVKLQDLEACILIGTSMNQILPGTFEDRHDELFRSRV